jgi:hypothetical protein
MSSVTVDDDDTVMGRIHFFLDDQYPIHLWQNDLLHLAYIVDEMWLERVSVNACISSMRGYVTTSPPRRTVVPSKFISVNSPATRPFAAAV